MKGNLISVSSDWLLLYRVELPTSNHLRDFSSNLEKYKAVQIVPMHEDRDQEDCKFVVHFFLEQKLL